MGHKAQNLLSTPKLVCFVHPRLIQAATTVLGWQQRNRDRGAMLLPGWKKPWMLSKIEENFQAVVGFFFSQAVGE